MTDVLYTIYEASLNTLVAINAAKYVKYRELKKKMKIAFDFRLFSRLMYHIHE